MVVLFFFVYTSESSRLDVKLSSCNCQFLAVKCQPLLFNGQLTLLAGQPLLLTVRGCWATVIACILANCTEHSVSFFFSCHQQSSGMSCDVFRSQLEGGNRCFPSAKRVGVCGGVVHAGQVHLQRACRSALYNRPCRPRLGHLGPQALPTLCLRWSCVWGAAAGEHPTVRAVPNDTHTFFPPH